MTFEEYKQMAEEFISSDDYLFLVQFLLSARARDTVHLDLDKTGEEE